MDRISVVEARRRFSELLARVAYANERVVIERRGRPMMALVSVEDLRRLEELEGATGNRHDRRQRALELIRRSRETVLTERGGVPFPGSATALDELREGRTHELASLR